ncbi:hypothetical protein WN55_09703 [Dufourea novaeangliae]|uniref:Uncharacterized protein n=1 Tax=Dufourea novaeangliae TaxID=178035 RepID=A0A154P0M4_DUFNO|nr:hypothetical protein WN55_09703 [Dufourea novaeangliae]
MQTQGGGYVNKLVPPSYEESTNPHPVYSVAYHQPSAPTNSQRTEFSGNHVQSPNNSSHTEPTVVHVIATPYWAAGKKRRCLYTFISMLSIVLCIIIFVRVLVMLA